MAIFDRWREDRALQKKSAAFVASVMRDPDPADAEWLAKAATKGDLDHASWELRYARRALGLIIAQRDALDDKTGSAVARELSEAMTRDQHVDASTLEMSERQFNARVSAYRDGLDSKASGIPVATRLGQTLFAFSGGAFRDAGADVVRGGDLLVAYAAEANAALRVSFGTAELPEDIAPSEIGRR